MTYTNEELRDIATKQADEIAAKHAEDIRSAIDRDVTEYLEFIAEAREKVQQHDAYYDAMSVVNPQGRKKSGLDGIDLDDPSLYFTFTDDGEDLRALTAEEINEIPESIRGAVHDVLCDDDEYIQHLDRFIAETKDMLSKG